MNPNRTNYPSLRGKTVLITGGATGIGESFVEHFFDQSAKVAFFDIDTDAGEALADKLGASLREDQTRPMFLQVDLTDIDALRKGIADVRAALGPIGVLVNNAANDKRHKIEDVTPEFYDQTIAVNIRHQFFAAQAVIEDMKQLGGGSIINLGSVSWMIKNRNIPVYLSSKAGVQGMTRGLAKDLGQYNICVNTLVPGWVITEKQKHLWLDDAGKRAIKENQCIDAEVLPQHLARAALFLASDDSSMMTAQDLIIDGGWV
ncbi:putative oxidoreductase in arabinose utilization cluster [Candidatus Burkholderia pumila]|uniref:Oxidoreductase in arabinose utilization cluster n=1 Tax=Candidatus Burkholderia pumila TaxID=1090375 RepID=A0ABR5HL91_9BURK|nr:putative oxidoreductase in arabinose utilization cluster [Candidatus Burkholderia pumila]